MANCRAWLKEYASKRGEITYTSKPHPHNGLNWWSFTCEFFERVPGRGGYVKHQAESKVMKNKKAAQEDSARLVIASVRANKAGHPPHAAQRAPPPYAHPPGASGVGPVDPRLPPRAPPRQPPAPHGYSPYPPPPTGFGDPRRPMPAGPPPSFHTRAAGPSGHRHPNAAPPPVVPREEAYERLWLQIKEASDLEQTDRVKEIMERHTQDPMFEDFIQKRMEEWGVPTSPSPSHPEKRRRSIDVSMVEELAQKARKSGPILEEVKMEVKREPVQALGRSSVVEEEAPQEPEPEPSNPIGTLEEVGEARIARRPRAVRGGGAEPKLCTTGALLILDLDNDQGEDALNLLRNHMKRFPGKHGISRVVVYTNPFMNRQDIPAFAEQRKYRYKGDGSADDECGITQISFDVGSMLGALVRKTKLRGLLFFSLHVFGDELIEMIKEYKIEAVWCNGLRSLEKTLDGIQQRARSL